MEESSVFWKSPEPDAEGYGPDDEYAHPAQCHEALYGILGVLREYTLSGHNDIPG